METPDPNVSAPGYVQQSMAKLKEFVESTGGKIGKVVAINSGPPVPRLIYHHQATGAVRLAQDRRLDNFVHNRFGNS